MSTEASPFEEELKPGLYLVGEVRAFSPYDAKPNRATGEMMPAQFGIAILEGANVHRLYVPQQGYQGPIKVGEKIELPVYLKKDYDKEGRLTSCELRYSNPRRK